MASYSSPTFDQWLTLTGLSEDVEQQESTGALRAWFADMLPFTEAECANRLGRTFWASTDLSATYDVPQFQMIVLHRQASKYFARVEGQSNTGTAAPIGIHLEGRSPEESASYHARRARALELALLGADKRERALLEEFS